MTRTVDFSEEDRVVLNEALAAGNADQAFMHLADYLRRNNLQLSDETLRCYAQDGLFACFSGQADRFTAALRSPSG